MLLRELLCRSCNYQRETDRISLGDGADGHSITFALMGLLFSVPHAAEPECARAVIAGRHHEQLAMLIIWDG
jgi:hypothetical protein